MDLGIKVANPFSSLIDLGSKVLDRVLPDKAANDAAKAELLKIQLTGELAQIAGQLDINKVEAASSSIWVAGWRPAFGWVGAAGLAYQMVVRPLLSFTVSTIGSHWFGNHFEAPSIEIQDLLALVGTMLGFGAMRSFDKSKGTDTGH